MFKELLEINRRPRPYEVYTAAELWTDPHTSSKMLEYHLNDAVEASSRNSAFIQKSVDWIVTRFGVGQDSAIADFGCGPGLYASRLARHTDRVTGIDFSKNSLRYAGEKAAEQGLNIDYVLTNYLDYETDRRFDLIIMIMCDFCALSPEQRQTLLAKFRSLLKPGGRVLLDVHSLNYFDMREESAVYELNQLDGFWSPDDYYCFVNTFKYEPEKVLLDKYTIIEPQRTRVVYNWLQCFSPDSLGAELAENGFEVEDIYADVAGGPFNPEGAELAVAARIND